MRRRKKNHLFLVVGLLVGLPLIISIILTIFTHPKADIHPYEEKTVGFSGPIHGAEQEQEQPTLKIPESSRGGNLEP